MDRSLELEVGGINMKRTIFVCAFLGIVLTGCGISQHVSKPPASKPTTTTGATAAVALPRTWHIGGFTVQELPLPSDFFKKDNRELVVGGTLLKMGAKPPYSVTWQSLTSKQTGTAVQDGCPEGTLSAYADQNDGYNLNGGYAPGYAGFVCVGREKSQLTLVHVPDMKVSTFPLPGYSKSVQDDYGEYRLGAGIFGSPNHQYLSWEVYISESSDANLGSEIVDLTTGRPVASLPEPFNQPFLASPNGTLFTLDGHTLSEWNGTTFKALGTISNLRVAAVGDSGAVWADQPSPSNVFADTVIRETPGSTKTQSWNIVGSNIFIRPGFVAYTPGESIEGPVKLFFPESHRTLTFQNTSGQPMLDWPNMDNDQIVTHSDSGPVVIEVIPPS
ncbi:MAG: hypothetical protein M0Z66_12470 [Thermaerobacter sp.]|nr:hypothetical protein [Thermaerobacter sp.]